MGSSFGLTFVKHLKKHNKSDDDRCEAVTEPRVFTKQNFFKRLNSSPSSSDATNDSFVRRGCNRGLFSCCFPFLKRSRRQRRSSRHDDRSVFSYISTTTIDDSSDPPKNYQHQQYEEQPEQYLRQRKQRRVNEKVQQEPQKPCIQQYRQRQDILQEHLEIMETLEEQEAAKAAPSILAAPVILVEPASLVESAPLAEPAPLVEPATLVEPAPVAAPAKPGTPAAPMLSAATGAANEYYMHSYEGSSNECYYSLEFEAMQSQHSQNFSEGLKTENLEFTSSDIYGETPTSDLLMELYMMSEFKGLMPKTSSPILPRRRINCRELLRTSPESKSYIKWMYHLEKTPSYIRNKSELTEVTASNYKTPFVASSSDSHSFVNSAKRYKIDTVNDAFNKQIRICPTN